MHSYNVLKVQLTVSMHIRVAAMQRGQEVMDILFSSYRILDGYFCTAWFQRRGHVTGSVSGAWLVVVWSVVLIRVDIPEHAAQHDDETKHGETY